MENELNMETFEEERPVLGDPWWHQEQIIKKLIYYNLKHSFDIAASNHVYAIGYDQPIMVTIPHDTIEGSGLTYRHVVENLYTRLLDMENEAGKASSDREEN